MHEFNSEWNEILCGSKSFGTALQRPNFLIKISLSKSLWTRVTSHCPNIRLLNDKVIKNILEKLGEKYVTLYFPWYEQWWIFYNLRKGGKQRKCETISTNCMSWIVKVTVWHKKNATSGKVTKTCINMSSLQNYAWIF